MARFGFNSRRYENTHVCLFHLSMQLDAPTSNWSFRRLSKCFKFLSRKLTFVPGDESDCTDADTVDANSELQRYTA